MRTYSVHNNQGDSNSDAKTISKKKKYIYSSDNNDYDDNIGYGKNIPNNN